MLAVVAVIMSMVSLLLNGAVLYGARTVVKEVDRGLAEVYDKTFRYEFDLQKFLAELPRAEGVNTFNLKQNIPIKMDLKLVDKIGGMVDLGSKNIPIDTKIAIDQMVPVSGGWLSMGTSQLPLKFDIPINENIPVNLGKLPYNIPINMDLPIATTIPIDIDIPIDVGTLLAAISDGQQISKYVVEVKVADTELGRWIEGIRAKIAWVP